MSSSGISSCVRTGQLERWHDGANSFPSSNSSAGSIVPGLQDIISSFVQRSRDASVSQTSFVQAVEGAGTALVSLAAAFPVGIAGWFSQVAAELPRGPAAALYRFVEIPVRGVAGAAGHLKNSAGEWLGGSLAGKDSFSIAFEVTEALALAALIFAGARSAARGGGAFSSGLRSSSGAGVSLSSAPAYALAFAQPASISFSGALEMLCGVAAMGVAIEPDGNPEPPVEPGDGAGSGESALKARNGKVDNMQVKAKLDEHYGDRAKVMFDLKISKSTLDRSVRELRKMGVSIPKMPRVPRDVSPFKEAHKLEWDLAEALRRHYGDRAKAGAELGLDAFEAQEMVLNAKRGSPLSRFKPFDITEAGLLDALKKSNGNWEKAAKKLGISPRRVDEMILDARPGSPLSAYRPVYVSDRALAEAIVRNGNDLYSAAAELGVFHEDAYFQILLADHGSPLFRFGRKGSNIIKSYAGSSSN